MLEGKETKKEKDLYFEVKEKEKKEQIDKTDNVVKTYKVSDKYKYPYLMIKIDVLPSYSIQVLKNSLEDTKYIDNGTPEGYLNVYLKQDKKVLLLGLVSTHNLKTVLRNELYKRYEKYLMITPEKKVEGDLMYSYCTSPHY